MLDENFFPTPFAIEVARKVFLYPKKDLLDYEDEEKLEKQTRKHERLKEFQKIAVLHGYEEAIKIYSNTNLDEEKQGVLKLIAEVSPMQVSGATVEALMGVVIAQKTHKDYAKLAEILMNQLHGEKGESGFSSGFEALVINTTKRKK